MHLKQTSKDFCGYKFSLRQQNLAIMQRRLDVLWFCEYPLPKMNPQQSFTVYAIFKYAWIFKQPLHE